MALVSRHASAVPRGDRSTSAQPNRLSRFHLLSPCRSRISWSSAAGRQCGWAVVPWRLATIEGFRYRTTAMNGAIELGEADARVVATVWLLLAIGFLVAAYGVWRGESLL